MESWTIVVKPHSLCLIDGCQVLQGDIFENSRENSRQNPGSGDHRPSSSPRTIRWTLYREDGEEVR